MNRSRMRFAALGLTAAVALAAAVSASGGSSTKPTLETHEQLLVIGHRGASGYRPEHTLAAYKLAIDMGADYIEPDLVSTKDGILVARHEPEIEDTTDVELHPEFAGRRKTKVIDGITFEGFFTEDFTLAELKTLRAEERIPANRPGNTAFNGLYEVPTLQEVIDLAKREGVGIYPETKHPTYHDSIGLSLEEELVEVLHRNGYTSKSSPVFVQSFEVSNLQELNEMTKVPLVQLISDVGKPWDFVVSGDPRTYADLATPAGLREISTYADGVGPNKNLIVPRDAAGLLEPPGGVGPNKNLIVPRDAAGRLQQPTQLVRDAHRVGLEVHPWTFRRENPFLPLDFRQGNPASPAYIQATGDFPAELRLFYSLGVDGVFTDNPDVAVAVRETS